MNQSSENKSETQIARLLHDLFDIGAVYHQHRRIIFSLSPRFNPERCEQLARDRLKLAGYDFELTRHDSEWLLSVDPTRRLRIPALNLILFVATLLSVHFVSGFYRGISFHDLLRGEGLMFTLPLISILLIHEMGHFVASRRRGIATSWPYFIPAPNLIGTFGAIIKSKSPFLNRGDLLEVGAAGPIAGWIVAVGWLVYGLYGSTIFAADSVPPFPMVFSLDGESILMRSMILTIVGSAPDGHFYSLTDAAFAGWVGLLITAINMLPIGQLDGGHIIYGLARKHQYVLARLAMVGLLILGFQSLMWWLFAAFGLIFGIRHPPTLNDATSPDRVAKVMGIVSLIILLLSFTPVPFPWH